MVGLVITLLSVLSLNPFSLANLASLPLRLWSLLVSFFRVKRKPWGTVFNSITLEPLDPAYVVLKDEHGTEIATSTTDIDGRYGFLTKPGIYTITVNKTNYTFPSKLNKTSDELYSDLYYGGNIEVTKEGQVITLNIPMDPTGTDWNNQAKQELHLLSFYTKQERNLARISSIIFTIGLVVSILALLTNQSLYNILIFSLYALIFILRQFGFKPKSYGAVVDSSGYGIPYAIIRIYSSATDTEITHKVTDATGRYYCLIKNGNYYAVIQKKLVPHSPAGTSSEGYAEILKTESFEVTKGYVSEVWEAN
jgi:hypothetical protein